MIVSGIQPTGVPHLGNYLGAIRNWVAIQETHDEDNLPMFFIADLHAISVDYNPAALRQQIRSTAAVLLAAGISPSKSHLFAQSSVKEHTELQWLLSSVAKTGWLNRMVQFKEKSSQNADTASLALYAYPVLQAADILLYGATAVPVGHDQTQHLELTRMIAESFNSRFSPVVPMSVPEALIYQASRVMSLRDGSKKMSKSDPSDASRINLTDGPDTVVKKIKRATTDSRDCISDNMNDVLASREIHNLLTIMAALEGASVEEALAEHQGKKYGAFKADLADAIIDAIEPIGKEYNRLICDTDYVDKILADGAGFPAAIARQNMVNFRQAMGL